MHDKRSKTLASDIVLAYERGRLIFVYIGVINIRSNMTIANNALKARLAQW